MSDFYTEQVEPKLKEGWEKGQKFYQEHPHVCRVLAVWAVNKGVQYLKSVYDNWTWNNTVLEIELRKPLHENPKNTTLGAVFDPQQFKSNFRNYVNAIEVAATDSKVAALVIYWDATTAGTGLGKMEEIRQAILKFRGEGDNTKPVVFYSEFYDTMGYYIASACSHILMPQCGWVSALPHSAHYPFFKGTLKKLEIEMEVRKRKSYKSALDTFVNDKFSKQQTEVLDELFTAVETTMFNNIAKSRAKLKSNIEDEQKNEDKVLWNGPYMGKDVVEKGLIDEIRYRCDIFNDEDNKFMKETLKIPAPVRLYATQYLKQNPKMNLFGKNHSAKIAYIRAVGMIKNGYSENADNGPQIGDLTVCFALRHIAKDKKKYKGVILHVDSRGGAYQASDLIANEIKKFKKETELPIVALMGNYAASGGYYISCHCDKIIASSYTLTGSIGVITAKVITKGMWESYTYQTFDKFTHYKENSTMYSGLEKWTESDNEKIERAMDYMYGDFVSNVAAGRKMTVEEVEKHAQGRVWTGSSALERKLVDELGGMETAINSIKDLSKTPRETKVNLVEYPKELTFKEILAAWFTGSKRKHPDDTSQPPNPKGSMYSFQMQKVLYSACCNVFPLSMLFGDMPFGLTAAGQIPTGGISAPLSGVMAQARMLNEFSNNGQVMLTMDPMFYGSNNVFS